MYRHIIYKNPVQLDTLAIMQYMHSQGIDMKPLQIIERQYPYWVTQLPSIYDVDNSQQLVGFENCVQYYERVSGISDLLNKATEFKACNPTYRINE
jgi:hypothetical protein